MVIAVCDDEKDIRDDIERRIHLFNSEYEVIAFGCGEDLLAAGSDADILFLDIQMPRMNGIEAAQKIRDKDKDIVIIFITAAEEYVFQAFDVGAFHYLVKPFDSIRFLEVLDKAVAHVNRQNKKKPDSAKAQKTIMVHSRAVHTNVPVDDILYAEVFNRKIVLHTNQEELEYYGKLSELEASVGKAFFRTHRAYLVNMKYIRSYDSNYICIKDEEIPIAKTKHAEFVKEYLRFMVRERKGDAL